MSKKKKMLYLDEKIFNEFRIYAITLGRSVSSLLEEHMREILKEIEKEK